MKNNNETSSKNMLDNHIKHIRELYSRHMFNVNSLTKEKYVNKHLAYKKFTGQLDEDNESSPIYVEAEARIKDVHVTADHDLMFDIIDSNDCDDIIFSFHVLLIKDNARSES